MNDSGIMPDSASIPPKAAVQDKTDQQGAQAGAEPPPKPYGQVTTHKATGQQFFYRWPDPPYLDNASECVTVYEWAHSDSVNPAAPDDEGKAP